MSKISILVPTYNQENYLRKALDSLINQTLDDIEILCINDGSTDKTPQILEEYRFKDKRIKVINKQNKKQQEKAKRRKMFSIRINSSRISIVLFGKQIVEIG